MTAEKPVPVTSTGLARLQAELEELLTVKRPAVAERIHQIRELAPNTQGDGEYEDAKNEQAFVEGRIRVIEKILATAEIIDEAVAHSQDSVHLGATVVVAVNGKTQEYTIVGVAEVDPLHGFVSDESPIGHALLGRKVGDAIEVQAPGGTIKLKIKAIK